MLTLLNPDIWIYIRKYSYPNKLTTRYCKLVTAKEFRDITTVVSCRYYCMLMTSPYIDVKSYKEIVSTGRIDIIDHFIKRGLKWSCDPHCIVTLFKDFRSLCCPNVLKFCIDNLCTCPKKTSSKILDTALEHILFQKNFDALNFWPLLLNAPNSIIRGDCKMVDILTDTYHRAESKSECVKLFAWLYRVMNLSKESIREYLKKKYILYAIETENLELLQWIDSKFSIQKINFLNPRITMYPVSKLFNTSTEILDYLKKSGNVSFVKIRKICIDELIVNNKHRVIKWLRENYDLSLDYQFEDTSFWIAISRGYKKTIETLLDNKTLMIGCLIYNTPHPLLLSKKVLYDIFAKTQPGGSMYRWLNKTFPLASGSRPEIIQEDFMKDSVNDTCERIIGHAIRNRNFRLIRDIINRYGLSRNNKIRRYIFYETFFSHPNDKKIYITSSTAPLYLNMCRYAVHYCSGSKVFIPPIGTNQFYLQWQAPENTDVMIIAMNWLWNKFKFVYISPRRVAEVDNVELFSLFFSCYEESLKKHRARRYASLKNIGDDPDKKISPHDFLKYAGPKVTHWIKTVQEYDKKKFDCTIS